ncbi:MAG TPA: GerMN domain-containing protein [Pyrinomonadaceae bacterium]|jgi:spore germination protein GerM|nr:GerMN domain-containing protein [Pyrinomonadaceae bacterium]
MKRNYLLLAALLCGVFLAGISPAAQAQTGGTMKIKIFLPKDDTNGEIELVAVERTVKKTSRIADAALRELLKGASDDDRKKGLTDSYSVKSIITGRDECQGDKMKPLGAYLIGVTIKKGVAIVNFRPEAECYLQSAITAMDYVMKPIEATLKQFPSIKGVDYALNGKIITEWDA